jgi:dTMP kinase
MTGFAEMAGKFIVFEGVEGAGKTTQIQLLATYLQNNRREVIVTREPGGTELGGQLRQMLLHYPHSIDPRAELLLYSADRAHHVEEVIRPQLARGGIAISDRFTGSTIAYQCYGRGLERDLVDRANALATDGITPDLTLWLDLEIESGLERVAERVAARGSGEGKDRFERLPDSFHHRVRQGYQELWAEDPHSTIRIDAARSIEVVSAEIIATVESLILGDENI